MYRRRFIVVLLHFSDPKTFSPPESHDPTSPSNEYTPAAVFFHGEEGFTLSGS